MIICSGLSFLQNLYILLLFDWIYGYNRVEPEMIPFNWSSLTLVIDSHGYSKGTSMFCVLIIETMVHPLLTVKSGFLRIYSLNSIFDSSSKGRNLVQQTSKRQENY